MAKQQGKYECTACGHKWNQVHSLVDCPKCNSYYVKWLNFESDFAEIGESPQRTAENQK